MEFKGGLEEMVMGTCFFSDCFCFHSEIWCKAPTEREDEEDMLEVLGKRRK